MQVSVEQTTALERRMTVEVPGERVDAEVENRLRDLGRTTRIKGFRPGKVPLKVVRSRYGEQVRQEVIGELVQSSFYEAVSKENLHPAGMPQIETTSTEPGKSLGFIATFEVIPEIKPAAIEGVKLEKQSAEVGEADVDRMVETLRKQRSGWKTVDRAAQDGDRVTIDFEGTIDGEEFKGNKGEKVPVTLGAGRMIDGFEAGLVGAKAGDELTLDLNFPEEYGYKEVAGKPVQFAVKVDGVEEMELPELTEEFIQGFGIEPATLEGLRAEVRDSMERELEQKIASKLKQDVMDKLLEINTIEVPQALIDNEAASLAEQMRRNMHVPAGKSGPDLDPSMFADEARRRVKLGLLLAEIIKSNELKADPEKVRATVEKFAAGYDQPEEVVNWYYGDKRRLSEVESLVLEEQVVDWVLGQAEVEAVSKGFDEVMGNS